MKVCIICPAVYTLFKEGSAQLAGGAEAQLKTLGLALSERGYEVNYIVDDYGQADIEKIGAITFYKVPLRYMGGSNIHIAKDWLRLICTLHNIGADIHLVKVPRNILLPLTFYAVTHRKKTIYIGQSDLDFDKKAIISKDNIASYWFYRIGMHFVSNVVSQTARQQLNFENTFNKKSVVIPNVVTLPGFSEYTSGKYVLWVGNSSKNKQPELFLDIAERLPNVEFKMIMSLANDRKNDDFIKKRAENISNLEYLGFVPFQHIEKYYEGAALLVCVSIIEGFPNTFLQSWQYSAPVVSLTFDPDSIVKKYGLGKISGTLSNLVNDVEKLMNNEIERKKMAVNALQYIEQNHTVKASVSRYIALFNDMGCKSDVVN